jgi:hypothetical protein
MPNRRFTTRELAMAAVVVLIIIGVLYLLFR